MADQPEMPDETNPEVPETGMLETVGKNLAEVPEGMIVGTAKFGKEASDVLDSTTLGFTDVASQWLNENVIDLGHLGVDENNAVYYARGVEAQMREAERQGLVKDTPEYNKFISDNLDKINITDGLETIGGNVSSSLTQFGLGFLTTRKVSSKFIEPTTSKGKKAKLYGDLLGAELLAFDKHEERLANFLDEYPPTSGAITNFLKADPNDPTAEAIAKQALEALAIEGLTGSVIEGTLKAVKAIRQVEARVVDEADKAAVAQQNYMQYENFEEGITAWRNANQAVDARYLEAEELTGSARQQTRSKGRAEGIAEMTEGQQATIKDFGGSQTISREVQMQDAEEFVKDLFKDRPVTKEEIDTYVASVKNLPVEARLSITRAAKLQEISTDIYNKTLQKYSNGEATLEETMEAFRSNVQITSFVHGGIANAARTLDMAKELDNLSTPTIKMMIESSAKLSKNPTAMSKYMNSIAKYIPEIGKKTGTKAVEMLNELFINSILSGVKTQTVNLFGNTFMSVYTPIVKGTAAIATGNKDEAIKAARLFQYMGSNIVESGKMAAVALYRKQTLLDNTNNTLEEGLNTGAWPWWLFGNQIRYPTNLLSASDEFYKQVNFRGILGATLDQEARALNLKGTAKKEWIKENFNEAIAEQLNASLRGTKSRNPYVVQALEYAREQTFTAELRDGVPKFIQDGARKMPILRQVFTFVRTPTNIVSNVVQNSPVGFLSKKWRDDINAGGQRRAEAVTKLSLGTALTMYLTMGGVEDETFTGSGIGLDYEQMDNLEEMTGYMPNAYYSKDAGAYRDLSRLSPAADLVTITASIKELTKYGMYDEASHLAKGLTSIFAQHADDPNFAKSAEALLDYGLELGGGTVIVGAEYLRDRTYLQGVDDLANIIEDPTGSNVKSTLERRVGALVPYSGLLKSLSTDPLMRELTGYAQQAMQNLPSSKNLSKRNSEAIDPRRNVISETVPKAGFWGYTDFVAFLSPVKQTEKKKDPLAQVWIESANRGQPFRISKLPKTNPYGTSGIDLQSSNFSLDLEGNPINPQRPAQTAYDQWHELIGETEIEFIPTNRKYGKKRSLGLRKMLETVVSLDEYKKGKTFNLAIGNVTLSGSGQKLISDVINLYRKEAFTKLVGTDPHRTVNKKTNSLNLEQFDNNNFIVKVDNAKNQRLAIAYWTRKYIARGNLNQKPDSPFQQWLMQNEQKIADTIIGDIE